MFDEDFLKTIFCRSCNQEFEVTDYTEEYWIDSEGKVHTKIDCDKR